jgi:stage IV sporulation protein FB
MLRFRVLGLPVAVHWSFWLAAAVFAGVLDLAWTRDWSGIPARMLAVFLSVLLHETGHAMVMRHFNGRPRMFLYSLGGLTWCPGHFTRAPHFLITLAGPTAGLICYGLLGLIEPSPDAPMLWTAFWSTMRTVNLWWSLLNFLPILPLDGGHLWESVAGSWRRKLVGFTGVLVALICLVLTLRFTGWQWFSLLLFGYLAYLNYQHALDLRTAGTPASLH